MKRIIVSVIGFCCVTGCNPVGPPAKDLSTQVTSDYKKALTLAIAEQIAMEAARSEFREQDIEISQVLEKPAIFIFLFRKPFGTGVAVEKQTGKTTIMKTL